MLGVPNNSFLEALRQVVDRLLFSAPQMSTTEAQLSCDLQLWALLYISKKEDLIGRPDWGVVRNFGSRLY
jgi:hypothetical protein